MFFSSVTMKISSFLFSFVSPLGTLFCIQLYDFLMDTLFFSQMVSSPVAPFIIQSQSLIERNLAYKIFLFQKDRALVSHGRYITRALGGGSVPCESAEVGGGQWEWGTLAGFALCLAYTLGRRLTCEWPHQAHRSASACRSEKACWAPLHVVTGYLKPAGISESFLLFNGTQDVVYFSE